MRTAKTKTDRSQSGFSLIEMMIVIGILSIIMGAIFTQINLAQRNSRTEQIKLDLFQQAREFVDQMTRDLRGSGYPNRRNLAKQDFAGYAYEQYSEKTSVGLVELGSNKLWYEAAAPDGQVWVVRYRLQQSGLGCPCLQRSQTPKVPGDPITGQTGVDQNYVTEVQNVVNGTDTDPIFTAYNATTGAALDLSGDGIKMDSPVIAGINSIRVKLTVRSPYADPSGNKPSVTMISTVRLTNCSMAFKPTADTLMACD